MIEYGKQPCPSVNCQLVAITPSANLQKMKGKFYGENSHQSHEDSSLRLKAQPEAKPADGKPVVEIVLLRLTIMVEGSKSMVEEKAGGAKMESI